MSACVCVCVCVRLEEEEGERDDPDPRVRRLEVDRPPLRHLLTGRLVRNKKLASQASEGCERRT